MTITFTSIVKVAGDVKKFEFTSPVTLGEREGTKGLWKTFEFKEPSVGENNMIEVMDDAVNIIAGRNTLNLSLGEKYLNEYIVEGAGTLFFETHLAYLDIEENLVKFEYSLSNQDQVKIGDYEITLKINAAN